MAENKTEFIIDEYGEKVYLTPKEKIDHLEKRIEEIRKSWHERTILIDSLKEQLSRKNLWNRFKAKLKK